MEAEIVSSPWDRSKCSHLFVSFLLCDVFMLCVIVCYLLAAGVCVRSYSPTRWAPGVHCSLSFRLCHPSLPSLSLSAVAVIFTVRRATWLDSVRISFLAFCVSGPLTLNSWLQVS